MIDITNEQNRELLALLKETCELLDGICVGHPTADRQIGAIVARLSVAVTKREPR